MTVTAPSDDLALAVELVDAADRLTLARYGAADLAVQTKPDLTPVTEADQAVERAMRERLAQVRPADAVLGEEYGGPAEAGSGRRWIVDPIDGTANYARGIPIWATLLALQDAGELTVAVVSAPALGRRWWAVRSEGAYVEVGAGGGGRRLRVSSVDDLADAQMSFAGLEQWQQQGRLAPLLALVEGCWRTRSFGDFWAYMLVAEGAMEVAIDPVVSLWDLAAVQLIVEEAGGRFTDLTGVRTAQGGDAIATNGVLHDTALAIVGR